MFENRDDYFANYIEEDKAGKAQFLWVSLFYFMAKVCMDEYGTEGEKVIRQAVRDLGKERAVRKRQRSDEMGMEPNLVSMTKVIDLYGEPRFSFGKQISEATPEEKIIKVYTCPNCNIWARLEGKKSGSPTLKSMTDMPCFFNSFAFAVKYIVLDGARLLILLVNIFYSSTLIFIS